MVTSWWMLAGSIAIVVIVWVIDRVISRQRARRLRRLAERCGFRYSSVDRFALAARVRDIVSDNVLVRDLMYRGEAGGYVYAFTAICTADSRTRQVLLARERPQDCTLHDIRRGDGALTLGEQYRRLLHESGAAVEQAA